MTTPEYLPPDILEYLDNKSLFKQTGQSVFDRQQPSSIDVWSLGAILLEVLIGFPLWLSYKGRVIKQAVEATNCTSGLFGV